MLRKSPPSRLNFVRGTSSNYIKDILDSLKKTPTQRRKFPDIWPMIWVQRDQNVAPQTVIGLGDSMIVPGDYTDDAGFRFQHVMEGVATDEDTVKFAVTLDALYADKPGKAIIMGPCTVVATVINVTNPYLAFTEDDGVLVSTTCQTPIRMLYAGDTGEDQLVKALIGDGGIDLSIVPEGTPADVDFFLAIDTEGCLIKIPKEECPES
jgi:hypothetical protein